MPFLLVFIGLLMIVTGARNTHVQFARQVQGDFTGPGGFLTWLVAIGAVGSLGYVTRLQTFSKYFMALILLGMVLANKGFFAQFSAALKAGPKAPAAGDTTPFTITGVGNAAQAAGNALLGQPADTSIAETAKKAATGNNPGSDLIGSTVSTFTNWLKGVTLFPK